MLIYRREWPGMWPLKSSILPPRDILPLSSQPKIILREPQTWMFTCPILQPGGQSSELNINSYWRYIAGCCVCSRVSWPRQSKIQHPLIYVSRLINEPRIISKYKKRVKWRDLFYVKHFSFTRNLINMKLGTETVPYRRVAWRVLDMLLHSTLITLSFTPQWRYYQFTHCSLQCGALRLHPFGGASRLPWEMPRFSATSNFSPDWKFWNFSCAKLTACLHSNNFNLLSLNSAMSLSLQPFDLSWTILFFTFWYLGSYGSAAKETADSVIPVSVLYPLVRATC